MTGHPAPVVTWKKTSGSLPEGRVKYKNSTFQIFNVRKGDSSIYFCSAVNVLGSDEKEVFLVVVSLPRFTVKPPVNVAARPGGTLKLNCSATGDPKPIISWKKQGAQLPVGRSQILLNGTLVVKDVKINDTGNYVCVATSAGVFDVEYVTYIDIKYHRGRLYNSRYIIVTNH